MKRIILILALSYACGVQGAQTEIKYDTIGNYSYVSIQPIDALGQTITRLCVTINDNAVNTGTIYYELRTEAGEVFKRGNLLLTGEDYDGYATNEYLYNWVANKLAVLVN